MFKKITRNHVKSFLGNAYGHTKRFLTNFNDAFQTGKQIYAIAEPILSQLAPESTKQINKHVIKGIDNYEDLRNKVMETDAHVNDNVNQVIGKLKNTKIKLIK